MPISFHYFMNSECVHNANNTKESVKSDTIAKSCGVFVSDEYIFTIIIIPHLLMFKGFQILHLAV